MENRVRAARRAAEPADGWDVSHGRRLIRQFNAQPEFATLLVPPSAVAFVEIAEALGATPLVFRDWQDGIFNLVFFPDPDRVLPRLMAEAGFRIISSVGNPGHDGRVSAQAGKFGDLDQRDSFLRPAWRHMAAALSGRLSTG